MRRLVGIGIVTGCLLVTVACDSGHREVPTQAQVSQFIDELIDSAKTQGPASVCDDFASSRTMCERQLQDNQERQPEFVQDPANIATTLHCTYVLENPEDSDVTNLRVAVLKNQPEGAATYYTQIGIFQAAEGLRTLEAPYWAPQGDLDPAPLCAGGTP